MSELEEKVDENTVEDEATQDDTVVPVQYNITSFGADYDVEGLVNRLRRKDIIVPSFQRDYVWSVREASRFVESLLLGLPVPGVFLARDLDSKKLLVIDGQQRLKTLQFFYEGFFNPKDDDKTKRVFRLTHVQKPFDGLTYQDLKDEDKILLNDSIIHATIVKQEAPPEEDNTSIYHIFERLNTEGRKLNPQQIRVAIYHGSFINLIKQLNKHRTWREIFGKTSPTLKDQELILRFLAMYFNGNRYKRPMQEFLNKFASRSKRRANPDYLGECENLFVSTIDFVYSSIGTKAFRPERAINAAVFDSVMVGLAKRLERNQDLDPKEFLKAYNSLLSDKDYITAISQSTSDDKNVEFRLSTATKWFANI